MDLLRHLHFATVCVIAASLVACEATIGDADTGSGGGAAYAVAAGTGDPTHSTGADGSSEGSGGATSQTSGNGSSEASGETTGGGVAPTGGSGGVGGASGTTGFGGSSGSGGDPAACDPFADGPERPRMGDVGCGEPHGNTVAVPAGGDLQLAIDAAEPGDTITLENGATYSGNFLLTEKPGASCITIRPASMDGLPGEGQRIDPASHADKMPKVVTPNGLPAVRAQKRTHHFKLVGIEFRPTLTVHEDLIAFDAYDAPATTIDELPHHLELDRIYLNGSPADDFKRGIRLNSASTTIVNSYLSDIKSTSYSEPQAIAGWAGTGPFRIANNFIESSGINVLIGGASPGLELTPSDIEITHNHFFKRLSWNPSSAQYAGKKMAVKNLFELKHARRVLVCGNVFENTWAFSQSKAINFSPLNYSGDLPQAPWTAVEDVRFVNNVLNGAANGFSLIGKNYYGESQGLNRVLIRNNLLEQIGTGEFAEDARGLFFEKGGGETNEIVLDHNTVLNAGTDPEFAGGIAYISPTPPSTGFVLTNNIVAYDNFGLLTEGRVDGTDSLQTAFPGAQCGGNVIVGAPDGKAAAYPPMNAFAPSFDSVGFVDPASGNYRLGPGSAYANQSTEGGAVGVDMDLLDAALAR